MKEQRTSTNIMVTPLDFTAYLTTLVAARRSDEWAKNHPDEAPIDGADVMHKWGFVLLPDGGLYLICREGVGYPLKAGDKFDFEVTFERIKTTTEPLIPTWLSGDQDSLDDSTKEREVRTHTFFSDNISLTVEQIKAWPTQDPVNLKDFIRQFGDRLERNYRANRKTIEKLLEVEGDAK